MATDILLVEDSPQAVAAISRALRDKGYEVLHADAAKEGIRLFDRALVELAILDLTLKEGTGFDVCRHIRAHADRGATPIIMLTADTTIDSKTQGFAAGVDNYLTKPLNSVELVLWVEALLRRSKRDFSEVSSIKLADLEINPQTRSVQAGGALVRGLSDKEFSLLIELAKARPGTLSREQLIKHLWAGSRTSNSLEVHINSLRTKLGPQGATHVVTVRGVGYRLE